jgi:NAD(P)-dependent dehydrogenase (short-subunit alcohol dehydrogenase family)
VIAVNLTGVYLGLRAVGGAMATRGGGAIVATASVAGLTGGSGMPSYYASKHGVVGLVRAAATELAPQQIRVNAVCPGIIDTAILGPGHGVPEIMERPGQAHLLKRVGQADEVAQLVLVPALEALEFMTGGAYTVDGGMTATFERGERTPEDDARPAQLLGVARQRGQASLRIRAARQHAEVLERAGVAHLLACPRRRRARGAA